MDDYLHSLETELATCEALDKPERVKAIQAEIARHKKEAPDAPAAEDSDAEPAPDDDAPAAEDSDAEPAKPSRSARSRRAN